MLFFLEVSLFSSHTDAWFIVYNVENALASAEMPILDARMGELVPSGDFLNRVDFSLLSGEVLYESGGHGLG